MFGSWKDVNEFLSDLSSVLYDHPCGDPHEPIERCVDELEADLGSDATVYWVLGVVASLPWMYWYDERGLRPRADAALAKAGAELRRHMHACGHDTHPCVDDEPLQVPTDLLGLMSYTQEMDDWQPDPDVPDDEPPHESDFAEAMRCPRNLIAVVELADRIA
ncbi:hypothetical protein ABZ851_16285 [Streptomyces sp. NPDC047049]|uniref:hypothetical protein n=1 Tax=Streptomyces sp. NPDC047049 TaxID=3156688 RepID=UPI0033F224BA